MFDAFRNAWRLPDLRTKLLITGLILVIYQFGAHVPVVVLGNGENITKKLTVKAHRVTAGAKAKIEAAGGSVEIIPLRIKGIRATFRKHRKEELAKIYGEN